MTAPLCRAYMYMYISHCTFGCVKSIQGRHFKVIFKRKYFDHRSSLWFFFQLKPFNFIFLELFAAFHLAKDIHVGLYSYTDHTFSLVRDMYRYTNLHLRYTCYHLPLDDQSSHHPHAPFLPPFKSHPYP